MNFKRRVLCFDVVRGLGFEASSHAQSTTHTHAFWEETPNLRIFDRMLSFVTIIARDINA